MKKKADPKTREDRTALAKMVTRLFDLWKLNLQDQLDLLGLSANSEATLGKYRNGAPLADDIGLLERAAHLLAIHRSLRTIFPKNRNLAYRWITVPNRAFGGIQPLDIMLNGKMGIQFVARHLELEIDESGLAAKSMNSDLPQ